MGKMTKEDAITVLAQGAQAYANQSAKEAQSKMSDVMKIKEALKVVNAPKEDVKAEEAAGEETVQDDSTPAPAK